MRAAAAGAIILLLSAAGCATSDDFDDEVTGTASVAVRVEPNPIIAIPQSDGKYEFPFTVTVTERNGVAVTIDRVRADVIAFGTLRVYQQTLTRDEIQRLGYPVVIEGGGSIRIPFKPRREVPDPSMFANVVARVTMEGTDATGQAVDASTEVTVRVR